MTAAKSNIYWGEGTQGEQLKQRFLALALSLGLEGESPLAQYIAANAKAIAVLLEKDYNSVDLKSITSFINATRDYNQEKLYALISSNKLVLNSILRTIQPEHRANNSIADEDSIIFPDNKEEIDTDDEVFPEGKEITRLHKQKERNSKAVEAKKILVLGATGTLACEVCGFDFAKIYGDELGYGFAECHHRTPLAQLDEEHLTKLEDLAVLCANCHRMIHRHISTLTIESLRDKIKQYSQSLIGRTDA